MRIAGTKIGETAIKTHPAETTTPAAIGKDRTDAINTPDLAAIRNAGLFSARLYLHPKNRYRL